MKQEGDFSLTMEVEQKSILPEEPIDIHTLSRRVFLRVGLGVILGKAILYLTDRTEQPLSSSSSEEMLGNATQLRDLDEVPIILEHR